MKILNLFLIAASIVFITVQTCSQTVNFTIVINSSPTPISPYIYGANPEFTTLENLGARRLGGNRLPDITGKITLRMPVPTGIMITIII
jgi:hypothetical protein